MAVGQVSPLHDRVTDAEIANGTRKAEHDQGQRHDAEVGGSEQPGKQDADGELRQRADA